MSGRPLELRYDPVPALLSAEDPMVRYLAERDLLGKDVPRPDVAREVPEARALLRRQNPDGSWPAPARKRVYQEHHGRLVETWKRIRLLVERYELSRDRAEVERAAEFILSCQAEEGDIRGMIGNQYATYYTGAMMAVLVRAGYAGDARVEKGFRWLLSMRQDDGGWTIPILTHEMSVAERNRLTSGDAEPLLPDRSKPSSHNWTDMVLRALAEHPAYCRSEEARAAGSLLKSRFFQDDRYGSYRDKSNWVRFRSWWPNLATSLESLRRLGFGKDDRDIRRGLDWLIAHQMPDGLWLNSYAGRGKERKDGMAERAWISLSISRMIRRYEGD